MGFVNQRIVSLHQKWWIVFLSAYGAFVFLPFVAPVFMHWNLNGLGKAVYFFYSFFCHQLPERSLFFFGPKYMYSMKTIQSAWQNTTNPLILRQFIGNPQMGWKIAWSDRMISMYGGIWLAGLLWGILPRRPKQISFWVFILLGIPIVLDGGTHFISDFSGLGAGYRYTNDWLVILTNHAFTSSFYAGDALGSFNSWMRWITGFLFSFSLVWWSFPLLDEQFGKNPLNGMVQK